MARNDDHELRAQRARSRRQHGTLPQVKQPTNRPAAQTPPPLAIVKQSTGTRRGRNSKCITPRSHRLQSTSQNPRYKTMHCYECECSLPQICMQTDLLTHCANGAPWLLEMWRWMVIAYTSCSECIELVVVQHTIKFNNVRLFCNV